MIRRKLTLHRESLSELTADDLAGVVGGADEQITIPNIYCLTIMGPNCIHD